MTSGGSLANKVLVIDDDPNFARLVEQALEPAGIECVLVRSAEEALRLADQEAPRAVVTDGLLPGIRGDELAIRLRRTYPRERLPIVFISAFFRDMKSRLHLTTTCQVDAVLHKPITVEELKRAFDRLPGLSPQELPPQPPAPHALLQEDIDLELDVTSAVEMLAEYISAANERVETMRQALGALNGPSKGAALASLKLEAHRFRGSGGSFGLPEVSRLGAQVEDLLEGGPIDDISAPAHAQLAGLIEALGTKIARAGAGTPAGEMAIAEGKPLRLLLVDGPGELAVSCSEAAAKGQPIQVFADPLKAQEAAAAEPPDVAFVAIDRDDFDGLFAAELLRGSGVRPVVVMAKRASLVDRLEVQALGVEGYLHRLPDAAALWRMAAEYARPSAEAKVLAVDPDHAALGELALALAPAGFDVEPCPEPAKFFEALERVSPGLVVLAADLPGFSGLDLLRCLRSDVRFRKVPAIVLSGGGAPKDRLAAFAAGADDFVQLPYLPEELAARATMFAARHGRESRAGVKDPLTGTFRTAYLLEACDRALHLARRGRPLAVMVFEAAIEAARPDAASLSAEEMVAAVSARIVQSFRVSDVIARIGTGRFGVLLHDVNRDDAQRLLHANLVAFQPSALSAGLPVKVRGAMATFPEVAGGALALLEAALEALEKTA